MSAPQKRPVGWPAGRRLTVSSVVAVRRPNTLDVIALVAPLLVAVEIRIVGRLFLAELVLLLSLPFLLTASRVRVDRTMNSSSDLRHSAYRKSDPHRPRAP